MIAKIYSWESLVGFAEVPDRVRMPTVLFFNDRTYVLEDYELGGGTVARYCEAETLRVESLLEDPVAAELGR